MCYHQSYGLKNLEMILRNVIFPAGKPRNSKYSGEEDKIYTLYTRMKHLS